MAQQYDAKDNSLTLYLNGIAHVSTSVKLQAKNGTAQIIGIAPKFVLESIHPTLDSKGVTITSARVLEPTSMSEIAESQIGKEVNDGANSVDALAIQDGQLLVKDGDDVYSKPVTQFRYKIGDEVAIRNRRAVELKLDGVSGEETVKLGYLTEGITLTPHYNISLSGDKLILTAEVKVDNKTGKSYKDVELEAIPGNVQKPYLSRGGIPTRIKRITAASALSVDMLCLAEDVTEFEEGGQVGYSFGKKDLPAGQSRFSVFKTKGLEYQMIYSANIGAGRSQISALLRFKAPQTLPVGSVAVYGEKQGVAEETEMERYEGGGSIHHPVLKDKDVNVNLREPDTLEMKVKQVGETRIVKTDIGTEKAPVFAIEREFKVTVNNAGQDNVTIETYLDLRATERLLESSLQQHEKSSGRRVRWDISVDHGRETELAYKIQNLQFQPIPEDVIRRHLGRGEDFEVLRKQAKE